MMELTLLFLLASFLFQVNGNLYWPYQQGYHNYSQTVTFLKELKKTYPQLVNIYPIGHSASIYNRLELQVLELTAPRTYDDLVNKKIPKRNVHLIGSIFGNEPTGRDLLLNFAYHLVSTYSKLSSPHLLDLVRIHILPAMNVDGAEVSEPNTCSNGFGKRNSKGVNLDGNFPLAMSSSDTLHANIQPETKAVIKWMKEHPSVMSLMFRGGAYVVAYPYETRMSKNSTKAQLAPDDDILKHLAQTYANNNPIIKSGTDCNTSKFENGVVNGAVWRNGKGGFQDYSYVKTGSMHLNVAFTCCKHPKDSQLQTLWEQNQNSLLAVSAEACGGVDGVVLDANTRKPISEAKIAIVGRVGVIFHSTMNGTFSRVLLPGSYMLKVMKEGYKVTSQLVHVNETRTLHVSGHDYTVHVGYVEVLLNEDNGVNHDPIITEPQTLPSPSSTMTSSLKPISLEARSVNSIKPQKHIVISNTANINNIGSFLYVLVTVFLISRLHDDVTLS